MRTFFAGVVLCAAMSVSAIEAIIENASSSGVAPGQIATGTRTNYNLVTVSGLTTSTTIADMTPFNGVYTNILTGRTNIWVKGTNGIVHVTTDMAGGGALAGWCITNAAFKDFATPSVVAVWSAEGEPNAPAPDASPFFQDGTTGDNITGHVAGTPFSYSYSIPPVGWISPEQFGAVGDRTNDDSYAWNSMVQYIGTTMGTNFVPKIVLNPVVAYKINNNILIKDSPRIYGSGNAYTTSDAKRGQMSYTNMVWGGPGDLFQQSGFLSGAIFDGLSVDCLDMTARGVTVFNLSDNVVLGYGGQNVQIKNSTFANCYCPLVIDGSDNVQIDSVLCFNVTNALIAPAVLSVNQAMSIKNLSGFINGSPLLITNGIWNLYSCDFFHSSQAFPSVFKGSVLSYDGNYEGGTPAFRLDGGRYTFRNVRTTTGPTIVGTNGATVTLENIVTLTADGGGVHIIDSDGTCKFFNNNTGATISNALMGLPTYECPNTFGTLVSTNLISGRTYTNFYGTTIYVSASAAITPASAVGSATMGLRVTPAAGGYTNVVGESTIVGTIANGYTNVLAGPVPRLGTYTFTNTSAGGGNSSAILTGSGQIRY